MKRSLKKTPNTRDSVHGVLVDVYGVGILILGPSGVGKSECALDLVSRGHRLVADDLVIVSENAEGRLIGEAPELSRHHIEVRGLGVFNLRDLYGVAATRESKSLDLAVELVPWDTSKEFDRLGIERDQFPILNTKISHLRVPLCPGRNITTVIEAAAKNQILLWSGRNPAIEFAKSHKDKMCEPS